MVVKRDGTREPWDRTKMVAGIQKAIVNRPVTPERVTKMADRIEEKLRRKGPEITSQEIGLEVLRSLQKLDQVAYLRFASVYKDFQAVSDFERELGLLLQKKEPVEQRRR